MLRYSFWGRSSYRIAEVLFIVVGTDHNIRGATSINIEFVLTLINVHFVWILSFLSLILIAILSNSISLYYKVLSYSHKIFWSPVVFDFISKVVFKFRNSKISHIPCVGIITRFVVIWINSDQESEVYSELLSLFWMSFSCKIFTWKAHFLLDFGYFSFSIG